jgi:D-alanyl-D-alanine carboxypeptidase
MTTLATSLLTACNASRAAEERDAALDAAIPAAMQRASVPGAIVGIWQDGRAPYVRARTVFPAGAEFPSPHAHGYFKMPDGKVVDATDWNPSWGWAAGNMISTLDDMRVWVRDLAIGKLISPAMKRERDRFLPAPPEGEGALYGLAIENQNGWIGHHGNIMSYIVYPFYLPAERITMVVLLNSGVDVPGSWAMMQDITRIISPNHPWPNLPKK